MGRHIRAHDCGLCTWKAHGRAVVEEVRGTTEGKCFVSGLFPEEFEEFDRLSMGEDCDVTMRLVTGHDVMVSTRRLSVGTRRFIVLLV